MNEGRQTRSNINRGLNMRRHLTKLFLFAVLQFSIFALASRIAIAPPLTPIDVALSHEQRLRQWMADGLYRDWLNNSAVLAKVTSAEGIDPRILGKFVEFRRAEDEYLMSIIDKDRLLRTAPGRRLIFLGGSNLAFGMDCHLLKERYGLTPVNLGLFGPLRAGFPLNHAMANVRRGDVVVYCFEYYPMLLDAGSAKPQLRERVCAILPSMRQYFDGPSFATDENDTFAEWKQFGDKLAFAQFTAHVWDVADRCRQRFNQDPAQLEVAGPALSNEQQDRFDAEFAATWPVIREKFDDWKREKAFYARSNFNEYGDHVGHYGMHSDRAIEPCITRPLTNKESAVAVANLEILNDYAADFRAKGVEVFYAYPPVCEGGGEFATQFEALVNKHLDVDVPILFPIVEATNRIDECYDAHMHLTWEGICRRMQIVTTALDRYLTPCVAETPAEHVALRNQSVRAALAAKSSDTMVRR